MIFLFYVFSGVGHAQYRDKISPYIYEDTKQLVMLVENAASLIERKGDAAFKEFSVKNSIWFNDKFYIFAYNAAGICVFHPIESIFMGQNLSKLKDIEGRSVIEMIIDIGTKPQPDASGWVFYLWEGPWHSYPRWKGSYVRKAVAPDGKVCLVGSGLYDIKVERVFIQDRVDKAAELILTKGKDAAFKELGRHSCPLHILDTYISVTDVNGDVVVDPLFPNLDRKRNIMQYRDSTGRKITEEVQNSLADKDHAWTMYIAPRFAASRPVRHQRYTRKVTIGGEVFYVSGSFVPPTPIWMKQ